jgi:hypothetical protein
MGDVGRFSFMTMLQDSCSGQRQWCVGYGFALHVSFAGRAVLHYLFFTQHDMIASWRFYCRRLFPVRKMDGERSDGWGKKVGAVREIYNLDFEPI